MAWLRVEASLFDPHSKVLELSDRLKLKLSHDTDRDERSATVDEAIAYLLRLWMLAARVSPVEGDLTRYRRHLARVVSTEEWYADLDDLVEIGVLDRCDDGRIVVHDWYEIQGRHLERLEVKKSRDRERLAAKRERHSGDVVEASQRCRSDVAAMSPRNENENDNENKERDTRRISYPYDWMSRTWNKVVIAATTPDDFKHDKVRRWWKARTEPKPEFVDLCNEIARSSWLTKDFAHELPPWAFWPRNWGKIMSGKYRDKGKPDMHVGATPAPDDWMYDTYRINDFNKHGDHERWDEYAYAMAELPSKTAPPFEEWLAEKQEVDE